MIKNITIKQIMAWKPCYSERQIKTFSREQGFMNSATPLEIAQCSYTKKEDLLWLLFHKEIIPEMELHGLACKFAEDALERERKAGREPHEDSWNAIKVKRLWMKEQATDEQLIVALVAAKATAGAASWAEAGAAAGAAAWATAMDAEIAARAAARVARAAGAVEEAMQLEMVIKILLKYK